MHNCFTSTNATILSFPAYSGGKFLRNCLALSKHACPQDSASAAHLINNPEDYDFRLRTVLSTLPSKTNMQSWRSFEFGCTQLFGNAKDAWSQGHTVYPNDITLELCASAMKFFLVDHSMEPVGLATVWPNATILRLINSSKWQTLSLAKKNTEIIDHNINGNYCEEKYLLLKGANWPDWISFEQNGYDARKFPELDHNIIEEIGGFYRLQIIENPVLLFDVDRCYFDWPCFEAALADLYQALDFNDFQPSLVKTFYDNYVELHN